jgi:hypothetical protein
MRLFDPVEQRVRGDLAEGVDELEGEVAADDRSAAQRAPRALRQTAQATPEHEPDALGDVHLTDPDLFPPFAGLIEQLPFLEQVLEDLFDEEAVPLGLLVNGVDERRRGVAPGHRAEHRLHAVFREPRQPDPVHEPTTNQRLERAGKRAIDV